MKAMESRVNGRACVESARTDQEIKAQGEERGSELRAVLKAVKSSGQSMDLKVDAMEERRVAGMNALKTEIALETKIAEGRIRGETRALKQGIGLTLAFAVQTFDRVFSPQIGAPLFGKTVFASGDDLSSCGSRRIRSATIRSMAVSLPGFSQWNCPRTNWRSRSFSVRDHRAWPSRRSVDASLPLMRGECLIAIPANSACGRRAALPDSRRFPRNLSRALNSPINPPISSRRGAPGTAESIRGRLPWAA